MKINNTKNITLIFIHFFILTAATSSIAGTWNAYPPNKFTKLLMGTAWNITFDGSFENGDALKLESLILEKNIPIWSMVYFNSNGGNIYEAMQIGRILRKNEFNSNVGILISHSDEKNEIISGECYSACTIAFLGGRYRYLSKNSIYGVHRFSSLKKTDIDLDIAQIVSAEVMAYLREMDIDLNLFLEMAKTSPDKIKELNINELQKMNVLNFGFEKTKWSIEAIDQGTYLKAERNSIYGISKFILICKQEKPTLLYIIFDPQGHQNEVMAMKSHSLLIDGNPVSIKPLRKEIKNNLYNGYYSLNSALINQIRNAQNIGFALRFTEQAPVFLGFQNMDLYDGRSKLNGYLSSCNK